MIKINIYSIGKDKSKWVENGCEHYLKLLGKYSKASLKKLPAYKISASLSAGEIMKKEADIILNELTKGYNIALTDGGKGYDSIKFSKKIEKLLASGNSTFNFIIGGAYGLDQSVLDSADMLLSLSPFTFSHQIARIILLEQLFRAFSIINNTDYHK